MGEQELVSVWVGTFKDKGAFDAYFKEQEGNLDAPLNQLCKDFEMQWYDHDYQDTAGLISAQPISPEEAFAKETHLKIKDEAVKAAKKFGIESFNAMFVLHADAGVPFEPDAKFRGKKISGVPMIFLGTFAYRS